MRRRFIADTWTDTTAALTGDQAEHLARVLRAEPGQVYDIVANGFLHRAEIVAVSDKEVTFALHEELEADAALPLHLLLAVFKFDHFEWAAEKATELGVARITPVLARRTEKHLALAATKRAERWRRIALEASKQSRRKDYVEVQRILAEDLPGIPLWYPNNEVVHTRRVTGVKPGVSGNFDFLLNARVAGGGGL